MKFNTMARARHTHFLRRAAIQHVSASNLESLTAPTLAKHNSLSPNDKNIWDQAWDEEWNGLLALDVFETISERQYQLLRKIYGDALPSMAISTIKYDEHGNPKRAKYRLVALGNHEQSD